MPRRSLTERDWTRVESMTLFLIEREYADQLGLTQDLIDEVVAYNDENELKWLFSFLSADSRKSYCIYEAVDVDAVRRHAADLGLPADVIVEVTEVNPELFGHGGSVTGHPTPSN